MYFPKLQIVFVCITKFIFLGGDGQRPSEVRRGKVGDRKTLILSLLPNVFLQLANCICLDHKIYFLGGDGHNRSEVRRVDVGDRKTVMLFTLLNVFLKIANCICPDHKMYF